MKTISLILGPNSIAIEQSLKANLDDVSFQAYKDIDTMIRTSSQKDDADRILISTAGIQNGDITENLRKLSEFVKQVSVRTSVVFLLKNNSKLEYNAFFHENFNSPLYTDMVIPKVSLHELELAVTEEIEYIRNKYSAYQVKEIEVLEDSIDDTVSNSMDEFIVERPMASLPKFKTRTMGQKMFNKEPEYTTKELNDLKFNLELIKIHMNLLNNSAYEPYINMVKEEDKKEFYVKHNLIKLPKDLSEKTIKTIEKLYREDVLVGLQSLIDFNKSPNLLASKFINKTGKPIYAS